MPPCLPSQENKYDYIWADSAYSGECLETLLSSGMLGSFHYKEEAHIHPSGEANKELNST